MEVKSEGVEVLTFENPKTVFSVRGKELNIPIEVSENIAVWTERVQFILLAAEKTKKKLDDILELAKYHVNKSFYGVDYPKEREKELAAVYAAIRPKSKKKIVIQ